MYKMRGGGLSNMMIALYVIGCILGVAGIILSLSTLGIQDKNKTDKILPVAGGLSSAGASIILLGLVSEYYEYLFS